MDRIASFIILFRFVTDAIPDDGMRVLVCMKDGRYVVAKIVATVYDGQAMLVWRPLLVPENDAHADIPISESVAWARLPQPFT